MEIATEQPANKNLAKRGETNADDKPAGGSGGANTGTTVATPKQDPQQGNDGLVDSRRNQQSRSNGQPPPVAPQAAPQDEPAKPVEDVAWAKEIHKQVVTAANANDCPKASALATQLSSRAPAYYSANVENDRALKQCVPYINARREAAERSQRKVDSPKAATKPTTTKK